MTVRDLPLSELRCRRDFQSKPLYAGVFGCGRRQPQGVAPQTRGAQSGRNLLGQVLRPSTTLRQ
jgi:hypothetical protein